MATCLDASASVESVSCSVGGTSVPLGEQAANISIKAQSSAKILFFNASDLLCAYFQSAMYILIVTPVRSFVKGWKENSLQILCGKERQGAAAAAADKMFFFVDKAHRILNEKGGA